MTYRNAVKRHPYSALVLLALCGYLLEAVAMPAGPLDYDLPGLGGIVFAFEAFAALLLQPGSLLLERLFGAHWFGGQVGLRLLALAGCTLLISFSCEALVWRLFASRKSERRH